MKEYLGDSVYALSDGYHRAGARAREAGREVIACHAMPPCDLYVLWSAFSTGFTMGLVTVVVIILLGGSRR